MDERAFNQTWETEYICLRVKNISEAVKRGDHGAALDMLKMIREKVEGAKRLICRECGNERSGPSNTH